MREWVWLTTNSKENSESRMFICNEEPWSEYINRCRTQSDPSAVINLMQLIHIDWQKPLTLLSVFYNLQSCRITRRQCTVEITQMGRKLWTFCAHFSFLQFSPTVKKLTSCVPEAVVISELCHSHLDPPESRHFLLLDLSLFSLNLFMFWASLCDTIWTK